MSLLSDLQHGEALYIRFVQRRAAIEAAEKRLAELKAENTGGEWTSFLAKHPALEAVVIQRVEALARAGLLDSILEAALIDIEPPAPSGLDETTAVAPAPPASIAAPPTPSVAPSTSLPPAAPPAIKGRDPRTPRTSAQAPLAKSTAPVTVGPLDVPIPRKPAGSSSTKSQINYKITWAANYQKGFDDYMEGKPPRKLRPGEGPARDGYRRGRADAEAFQNASSTGRNDEGPATRHEPERNDKEPVIRSGTQTHDKPPGAVLVVADTGVEPPPRPETSSQASATNANSAELHIFSAENLEPFEVEMVEPENDVSA